MIVLADYNLNGDADRVNEYDYRQRCVERLVEIIIDIEDYLGAGRLFIP